MDMQPETERVGFGSLINLRELPPGPIDRFSTDELTSFVANISLFKRGRPSHEQEALLNRMSEAMDELKTRGVHSVALSNWNFGRESKPLEVECIDHRHDPSETTIQHWYVPRDREARMAKLQQRYMDYVVRFERSDRRRGWVRFLVRHPITALKAMFNGQPLPSTWRREPLSEIDYWGEQFRTFMRSIGHKA